MARPLEKRLYRVLVECEFFFIERGIREINEIYDSVKQHFPRLCDDNFLCSHYPGINNQVHNVNWGYWEFL
jgi:hypothetical protein